MIRPLFSSASCCARASSFTFNPCDSLNFLIDYENCFAATVPNMHMDGLVLVAVKEKPVTVLFENRGHVMRF